MMTSAADRYGQGPKVDIRNCYYLERSGKIDMSKAPAYYFSANNAYSYLKSWTEDQIKQMVLGSSLPISQYFSGKNNSSGMNNGDGSLDKNNTSKNYKELSDTSSMNGKLGIDFGDVCTQDDSGNVVNGKYSFSAGDSSLTGKDYPFPTVIKQDEGKRKVNVHYGAWPLESAYFEYGSGTIDIFDDMQDDGFAYKEFILNSSGQNITDLSFSVEEGEYAELVNYADGSVFVKDADGNYKINIKAKKAGATDITASWKVDGVSFSTIFNLVVTANLNLIIQPDNTIYMNSGETKTFGYGNKVSTGIENFVLATASDVSKDYSDKVTWTITSSKIGTGEENAFEIDNKYKDIFKITSNGFNGIVTVTATYDYNGNKYSTSANINILTNYTVGVCGNSYSEITINDTGYATMATSPTYGSFGPKNDESKYFIYERNDPNATVNNNLIKNVVRDDISLSSSDPDIQTEINNNLVDIKLSNLTTNSISNNDYNTRAITLSYRGDKYTSFECTLTVNIRNNNGNAFPLVVPVTVTTVPYKLTLDANGGSIENHTTKIIELTPGNDVDLTDIKPDPRSGYDFDGWYDENDNKITSVTPNAKDVYLKAGYVAKKSQINFNSALTGEESNLETITRSYDDFNNVALTNVTKEGYILEGWYDLDGVKVVDANGKILETELFNQYLLAHINDDTKTVELHANWIEAVKLTLNATDIDGIIRSSVIKNYEKGSILKHIDIPVIDTDYTFIGYADSENNIVVDKDGNLNNYVLSEDLILKALFTYKAYVVTDSFKNGNDYLIAYNDIFLSNDYSDWYRGFKGKQLQIYTDILNKKYISNDLADDNVLWNYTNNGNLYNRNIKYNLYNSSSYPSYLMYLGNSCSWTYDFTSGFLKAYRKVSYSNDYFVPSDEGVKIDIYELGDVTTDKYLPISGGGT